MENNTHGGLLLVLGSWSFHLIAILDRNSISFILGTIVSIMAIVHYWMQIRKNLKDKS